MTLQNLDFTHQTQTSSKLENFELLRHKELIVFRIASNALIVTSLWKISAKCVMFVPIYNALPIFTSFVCLTS